MRPIDFRFLIVWNNKAIPVIKKGFRKEVNIPLFDSF